MSLPAPRIRLLPDALINQIAAGEVVERPASIVKELIENSLDAGAGTVRVEVRGGGADHLAVADDGHGIAQDELALALTRHCTSKISQAADLDAISTLGFRGEALASIAAVARTQIVSRVADGQHAWSVQCAPGELPDSPAPASRARGTTVTVQELFSTLPARRQFLRRPTTETLAIQHLLRGLAFCVPAVGFSLSFEDRRQWQAVAARDERSTAQRWRAVFGAEFASEARFVERVVGEIRVYGWIGPPEFARAHSDLQFLAVNGRLVRDRQLAHGIRLGYGETLSPGRYACYALHLELPPSAVDVNVHPGKTEVRFRQLREVHDLLLSTVREVLGGAPPLGWPGEPPAAAVPRSARWQATGQAAGYAVAESRPPLRDHITAAMRGADTNCAKPVRPCLLGGRYLAGLDSAGDLILHDLAALLEAALAGAAPAERRPLLFPARIPAPPGPTAELILAELLRWGIEFAAIGPSTWALRAVPAWLPALDQENFVQALLKDRAFPSAAGSALARALAGALELPATLEARMAWLAQWTAGLAGLDPAHFARRLGAEEIAELFKRGQHLV